MLGGPVVVTLAAMAALAAPTAEAAARQSRPAPTTEATAPREAGEPIMAIVSIMNQQVTFYDADGWILRAPASMPLWRSHRPFIAVVAGLPWLSRFGRDR